MTTREKLVEQLEAIGMFNKDANNVVDLAIPELEKLVPDYRITWDRDSEGYPDVMYNVWLQCVKPIALAYTEQHHPQAWYKPLLQL